MLFCNSGLNIYNNNNNKMSVVMIGLWLNSINLIQMSIKVTSSHLNQIFIELNSSQTSWGRARVSTGKKKKKKSWKFTKKTTLGQPGNKVKKPRSLARKIKAWIKNKSMQTQAEYNWQRPSKADSLSRQIGLAIAVESAIQSIHALGWKFYKQHCRIYIRWTLTEN